MASELRVDKIIPTGGVPTGGGGGIIQVTTNTITAQFSTTSQTYQDTNLTGTITPKFATSKIMVMINQQVYQYLSSTGAAYFGIRLLRGSTVIHDPVADSNGPFEQAGYFRQGFNWIFNYLDSPNTTSTVTYKTMARTYTSGSGGTLQMQRTDSATNGKSYIHLMEISA
tara:strand:+ start:966 stop:1472 length:507 start_codon:yes stop_codon:yes gene_type:complete